MGSVKERAYRRHRFAPRYTQADVALLAEVTRPRKPSAGRPHGKSSNGSYKHYGDKRFERLAGISVAHLYNLRKSRPYREKRLLYEKTRPVQVGIGERRRPDPGRKPGYLRVDRCIKAIWRV